MKTLEQLCSELNCQYSSLKSWRKVAEKHSINPAMARMLALGYKPGRKIRERLNLPEVVNVTVVFGEVPPGAQVISAVKCASCGRWYISNHPRRKRCFICSPYRNNLPK